MSAADLARGLTRAQREAERELEIAEHLYRCDPHNLGKAADYEEAKAAVRAVSQEMNDA